MVDNKDKLENAWVDFLSKDRVQAFTMIMLLFTGLFLAKQIPLELFAKVSIWSIVGVFGADAADNLTNLRKF